MPRNLIVRRAESEADWARVVLIRTAVFIEEQDCAPEEEWDEHDATESRFKTCRHFLGAHGGTAVATARWHPHADDGRLAAKLERFAVLKEARRQGFGRDMVRHVVADALESGFDRQILHAQAHLERLYNDFGFVRAGDVFEEAGIAHVKMVSTSE